jgi:hypothetical protein
MMHVAYNFIASWQLIPEKTIYENGEVPRSCFYKVEKIGDNKIEINLNYTNFLGEGFNSYYKVIVDNNWHAFEHAALADEVLAEEDGSHKLTINFKKGENIVLETLHEIQPNGYLKITHKGILQDGKPFTNEELYHKQLMVLPYSSSASGVAIRPTEEGVIKHKALSAMEDQTNMQLNQIKEQVELLMVQANQIKRRKELSMMVYEAKINFKPQIGQTYHLYTKKDDTNFLSLVSPKNWGGGAGPYKQFISSIQLLADHTWVEV